MKSLLLTLCYVLLISYGYAQDTFADSLLRTRLLPDSDLQVSYNTIDFKDVRNGRTDVDPITEEFLNQVLDSLIKYPSKEMELRVGSIYQRMGRMDEARFHLTKALKEYEKELEQDPENESLLQDAFSIYFGIGDIDAALENLEVQRKIAPNDTNYYGTKFYLQLMKSDFSSALETAKRHMAVLPDLPEPYFDMTVIRCYGTMFEYQMKGLPISEMEIDMTHLNHMDLENGSNTMKAVFVASKMMEFFFRKMAEILDMEFETPSEFKFPLNSDDQKELDRIKQYVLELKKNKTFKNDYFVHYTLGIISFIQNDLSTAESHFEKAIASLPYWNGSEDNPGAAFINIHAIYLFHERLDAYETSLSKMIELRRDHNPSIDDHISLARARALLGNPDYQESLETASEMNPKSEEALVYQAEIQLLAGQTKEAEKSLDKLFAINADNEELYYALALLSLKTGDNSTAEYLAEHILDFYPEDAFALAILEHLSGQ